MPRAWRAALLPCALLAAACFSPSYENGRLMCNQGLCPEDYHCATDQRCWRDGSGPGGVDDAGADAAPPDEDVPRPGDTGPVVNDAELDLPRHPDAEDLDVAPADPIARLIDLEVTPGTLVPAFAPTNERYDLNLPLFTHSVTVKAVAANERAVLSLNLARLTDKMLELPVDVGPGGSRIDIGVEVKPDPLGDGGAAGKGVYRIFVSTGGIFTFVKAATTQVGMRFGSVVALSGDLMVVGAPSETGATPGAQVQGTGTDPAPLPPLPDVGAAFVYRRLDGHWQYEITLKPLHIQQGMKFGAAVAIAGDTVVVGAPIENGSANTINGPPDSKAAGAGAAFVFLRAADGWTQQAYLKASDAAVGDNFGSSVAITQTMPAGATPQPLTTIAVGAPAAQGPNNSPRTGQLYVFIRAGAAGPWTQQTAMPHPGSQKGGNEFGASVALSGDTLVAGAPSEDSGASGVNPGSTNSTAGDSGAVFVFTRNANTWTTPVYIKAPMTVTNANFGARLAVSGTLLAIAAPGDPGGGHGVDPGPGGTAAPRSGAVYLYRKNGNVWTLLHHIKAETPHASDLFGQGLAVSATTLVVGSPFEDASGTVYVYRPGADNRWSLFARLKALNAELDDEFGSATATEGDTVAAGAEGEASSARKVDGRLDDNAAPGSGAVYIY